MLRSLTLCCSLLALLAGCNSPHSKENMHTRDNMFVVDSFRSAQVNKAIITQRTIWAYHFLTDTAELNQLGHRDLGVLAAYYVDHAGVIRIRRAGASQALYDTRVAAVVSHLVNAGVPKDQLTVTDAPPAGSGMPSERVVTVLSNGLSSGGGESAGSSTSSSTSTSSP
ncbi:MAG: hypothetical protein ACYTG2_13450 [Planctomycetota bacterium]|jgi:hypothetical protein